MTTTLVRASNSNNPVGCISLIKALILFSIIQFSESLVYLCSTNITSQGIVDLRTFSIGDTVTFCVHYLPYNIKASFSMTVDTYQAVSLRRNFEVVNTVNTDMAFQVSNSMVLSQQVVN